MQMYVSLLLHGDTLILVGIVLQPGPPQAPSVEPKQEQLSFRQGPTKRFFESAEGSSQAARYPSSSLGPVCCTFHLHMLQLLILWVTYRLFYVWGIDVPQRIPGAVRQLWRL